MSAALDERIGQEAADVKKADAGDLTMWSVTTIIGVLDKPGLLYWDAEQTANAAIDSAQTWQAMLGEEGREATVKWLRDARMRKPKTELSATDLGTTFHSCAESYALTGHRPTREEVAGQVAAAGGSHVDVDTETNVIGRMLNVFDGWLQRFSPSYQATEVCVYSPTYGYAGQADGFLTIDGTRFIIDYKTSRKTVDGRGYRRKPYPEQVWLQLAAYRFAEMAAVWRPRRFEKFRRRYYLLSDAERETAVPVPEVDSGLVIQVTPESCEAYPIDVGAESHRAFLYAQEAFRWANETSKTVMGSALEAV